MGKDHCAPFKLSRHLAKGAEVGIVTSRMGSVSDNDSAGFDGYRASKAAVNAIGKSIALDLENHGVAVVLLHAGYVKIEMPGGRGHITPDAAEAKLVNRLNELTLAQTGGFRRAQTKYAAFRNALNSDIRAVYSNPLRKIIAQLKHWTLVVLQADSVPQVSFAAQWA